MNPTVLVIALIVIGWGGAKLLLRFNPQVSRKQILCAVAACVFAVLTVAREMRAPTPGAWYYASLVIAVVMGTFVLLTLFRHWDSQGPTHFP
jgi:phosphoglycerol transferase MdoB-like AlkP superfamily enzyme